MLKEEEQYGEFLIQLCYKIEEHKQEIKVITFRITV